MQAFLDFLQKYELWIYGVLGFIGLIYVWRVVVTYHEWRKAIFGLEKESAQRRFSGALSILVFIGLFAVVELMLVSFVAPTVAGMKPLMTPTLELLSTPTTSGMDVEASMVLAATPTLMAQPTLSLSDQGCLPGQVEWLAPQNGEEVRDVVELQGIVNVASLGFFKYEYSQSGSDTWNTIAGGTEPTSEDNPVLGEWNTTQLVPGDYLLRLVVLDNQNNAYPVCIISVRVLTPTD